MQQVGRKVRVTWEKGTTGAECGGNKENEEAASLAFPMQQSLRWANGEERLGEEFRVNKMGNMPRSGKRKPRLLQSKWVVIVTMAS